jgi:hypothetical protein
MDELQAIRSELHAVSTKLDTFMAAHTEVHSAIESQRLAYRVRILEDTVREWTAQMKLLRWVLGSSLIGAITGSLALFELLFRS